MIIDVHTHIGHDEVFDELFTAEQQLKNHEQLGIDVSIVQPAICHGLEKVMKQHDYIADLSQKYPGKFYGMANPNPHLPEDQYCRELERCIKDLGFVGVKIHTSAHGVNPTGIDAQKVYTSARDLGIPVMIHTGAGIPFANPSLVIPAAIKYPDVKFVLAHSGMMVSSAEIPIILELCPNVYADITWSGGYMFLQWIAEFGANRFMFGSDHPLNCGTELAKVRTSGFSIEQQDYLLYKSAMEVYHLDSSASNK